MKSIWSSLGIRFAVGASAHGAAVGLDPKLSPERRLYPIASLAQPANGVRVASLKQRYDPGTIFKRIVERVGSFRVTWTYVDRVLGSR